MEIRDKLNSLENYKSSISFNKQTIDEWHNDIASLYQDEEVGVQKYARPNLEVIKCTRESIFNYQKDVLLATYSAGYPIDVVKHEYIKTLEAMKMGWKHVGGYLSMLNMLSIAITLDLYEAQAELYEMFCDPKRKEEFEIKDHLIDVLFQHCGFGDAVHKDFMIAKPYAILGEIYQLAQSDKIIAIKKLKSYLQKNWFSALKRQDLIQETHKSTYGTHCGYWSFESGALVKIWGVDDSILKEQQYYPYDLVHYEAL